MSFFSIIFKEIFALNEIYIKFAPAIALIGLWCNGNTTVFGAVFLGSSPSRPTKNPNRNVGIFYFISTKKPSF